MMNPMTENFAQEANLAIKKLSDSPDLFPRLCLDVYRNENRPSLPDGWKVFADFSPFGPSTGYFGSCYVKETMDAGTLKCYAIFAHRGTVLDLENIVGNLIADLTIALELVPPQVLNALQFIRDTYNDLGAKYGKENITGVDNTGHSLGGVISDIIALCSNYWQIFGAIRSTSNAFENPGTKPILQGMIDRKQLSPDVIYGAAYFCGTCQADVNIINTYNEQIGKAYQIQDMPYDYESFKKPDWPISSRYLWNFYYIYANTRDQHSIEKICSVFANGYPQTQEINYPGTLTNGYKLYLSPARGWYWNGYAETLWNDNADIRQKYKDFSNFANTFIVELRKIYAEAPQLMDPKSAYPALQELLNQKSDINSPSYTQSELTQKFSGVYVEKNSMKVVEKKSSEEEIKEQVEVKRSSSKISCNII